MSSPVIEAAIVRRQIEAGFETGQLLQKDLPPPVAACLVGLSAEVLLRFCGLIVPDHAHQKVHLITAPDDRFDQVLREGFRYFQESTDPQISTHHKFLLYFALYKLIQAGTLHNDKIMQQLLTGFEGHLLRAYGELDDYIRLDRCWNH